MEGAAKGHHTDVIVVGGGHAGCEAALACARMGLTCALLVLNPDHLAYMPCNPHIGGSSKGHLVREIDALGGEMGRLIDKTFLQSRMLNRSKGPAVHALRAQADKQAYSQAMRDVIESTPGLTIRQTEVAALICEEVRNSAAESDGELVKGNYKYVCRGVRTHTGAEWFAKAVILCTGTYLRARCLTGEAITYTGPNGMQAATELSGSLSEYGIALRRFKTGTPARMDGRTLDYSKMEPLSGDVPVQPFSFSTDPATVQKEQALCYLTYTNARTHEIIRNNIHRSPIYAGIIEGTGPRYCPSIEDKVVKFADKDRHQVFIEPEGRYTNEMYVDGMSSSMPEDVQEEMYRTVPGLENCKIVKNAYAIEYDCLCPGQLTPLLEIRHIYGLYSAGQFNGSSGYEEAAAQGIYAGINAALRILQKPPLTIDRSEGYIGVLVDDLVTKDNREPYRMMTSRAEYRLLLRQDNADLRLRKKGYDAGLVSREIHEALCAKRELIAKEIDRLRCTMVGAGSEVSAFLIAKNSPTLKTATSLAALLCRPELDYHGIAPIDPGREPLPEDVIEQVEIQIRYAGYIERQERQVRQFARLEQKRIPDDLDYEQIVGLRKEARGALMQFRPVSVGQASRIGGVNPADISVLLVYLESLSRKRIPDAEESV